MAALVVLGCEKAAETYKNVEVTLTPITESNAAGDIPYDFCVEDMVGYRTDAGDRSAAPAAFLAVGQTSLTAKVSEAATKAWFYTKGAIGVVQTFTVPSTIEFESMETAFSSMVYCTKAVDLNSSSVSAKLEGITSPLMLNIFDSKGEHSGKKINKIVIESTSTALAGDISLDFETVSIGSIANESKVLTITPKEAVVGTNLKATKVSAVVLPSEFTGTITIYGDDYTCKKSIKTPVSITAGYYKTINIDFNTCELDVKAKLRIGVIGDSISSYQGIVPVGYSYYYPKSGCDVDTWQKTYWGLLITKYWNGELDVNVSWSGGCVAPTSVKPTGSDFVARVKGFVNPDIVLIHGGTNDCIASNGIDLGDFDYTSPFGALDKYNKFRQSYIAVIKYIQANWPKATIIVILGDHVTGDFATSVETIANHFKLPLVDFRNDGALMTKFQGSHPDANGMEYMAQKIYTETLNKIK